MKIVVLDDTYKHDAAEVLAELKAESGDSLTFVTGEQCRAAAAKLDAHFRLDGDCMIFDFTRSGAVIIA